MFQFLLAKLKHKKWMVLCLLIGNVLLIAVTASQPIYKAASFERMFEDEFEQRLQKTGEWPFTLRTSALTALSETAEEKYEKSQQIIRGFHLPVKLSRFHYRTIASVAKTTLEREGGDDIRMSVGYITGMEERIELIAGRMYEDTGDENLIEVIVNQEAMQNRDIFLDEELVFEKVLNEKEEPLHVKIVGIFVPVDNTDVYWTESQEDLSLEFFMKEELFKDTFYSRDHSGYEFKYDTLFDFHNIDSKQAEVIEKNTKAWLKSKQENMKIHEPEYLEVLETFSQKEKKISGTLFILQIPCLVLLCAFLFMISEQMLRMEQNEISMLKSRGAKRGQILGLYFLQSTLIAFVGLLIGLPLGMFLCSLLGSAGAFLEFDLNDLLPTALTGEALIYGIIAMGISIGMTVLPVVKYSGVSIVNLKQRSQKLTKPFWQKCFLDIILIALAGYAYYNFSKTQENIKEQVLRGESLDPFLYFGATFFILGLGLLFLRVHPLFIKLLYVIRKKKLSSAAYMSFLSTIRTSAKQQFIMLFVILTVSFGIFYATIARTILENAENNLAYFAPVDMMVQERWIDNSGVVSGEDVPVEYQEPDFGKYVTIEGLDGITKVLRDKVKVVGGRTSIKSEINLMGINTKEFGEMVDMPKELLPLDYYDYLNALANTPNGVLLSENMRQEFGCEIGNTLLVNLKNRKFSFQIIGFVDYWPTYQSKKYSISSDNEIMMQDEYLMVANLSYVQRKADVTPYEVWMNYQNDTTDSFYKFVNEREVKVKSYTDVIEEKDDLRKDTMLQGTNGILSLSFMVILMLCAVGYLIYWILSIRSRELLFGILRAMGMSKKEVFQILLSEQMFCGVLSVITGVGIGAAATVLYVPIIQNAYAATDQMLPLELVCQTGDLVKLFGTVIAVLVICITVLLRIVSKSNITGALKLGED